MAAKRSALPLFFLGIDPERAPTCVGHAAIHCGRGETPSSFAVSSHRDQAALTAERLNVGEHAVERLLKGLPAEPHALRKLVGCNSANEILARTSGRNGSGAVVGIGAGTDQRRIANPPPAFGSQP